ncbi:uncharacterized protein EV420DRAFT_1476827 [Desarmillaria tabescens]|uniref:DUF6533 domain-containing protein n=1 Tax=Armillaria tabescens TaxID=1929756 RepID=A0AA39NCF1_ARMTA|nr:uncharacterized protein EV420DRAFT_1476827 [Desarmillaria tabescens]KAK0463075.1 hypothetical protein EV420DRAFT_1476827 [Desarmillaria tabescens]
MAESDQEVAGQAWAVAWVAAACATCIVYDHLITFGEECNHIWPARMTLARVLFFVNRYVVEGMLLFAFIGKDASVHSSKKLIRPKIAVGFGNLSTSFCTFYLRWLSVNLTVQNAVVQGILVLRVWALYRGNKPVIGFAFFLYFGVCATLVGLTVTDYLAESVDVDKVVALPGCYADSLPSMLAGYWITPLAIESYLFIMVSARAFVYWKAGESAPTILNLMARDSMIYFAIILALLLGNLLMFLLGPPFLSSLLVNPLSAASCILGSRMLLNLRIAIDLHPSRSELEIPRNTRHGSSEYPRHLHAPDIVDESDSLS